MIETDSHTYVALSIQLNSFKKLTPGTIRTQLDSLYLH